MRVMFAGGGTGGHIYPALAVAEEIKNRQPDTDILFIAGTKGIEQRIVSNAGFPLKTIPVIGFPRKLSPSLLPFVWKLMVSVVRSRNFISGFRPSVMMATGGYVSGPPIIAARTLGIPVVIQEQNSFPGITSRKLARYVDIIFLGFQDAGRYFTGKTEIMVTGNPVRKEIGKGKREASSEKFGLNPALKTILILGGSQGSHIINTAVSEIAGNIAEKGIQVLWQTGRKEYDMYERFDGLFDRKVRVLPYIEDMVSAYGAVDLVVSRAGAMTIAEITTCGLPAVFIPLFTAAGNHQEHNARSLVNANAAAMIIESNLTPEVLEREIMGILTSDETLAYKSEASKRIGRKDAAGIIAGVIIERFSSQ